MHSSSPACDGTCGSWMTVKMNNEFVRDKWGGFRNLPSIYNKARSRDTKNWEQSLNTKMHFYLFIYH